MEFIASFSFGQYGKAETTTFSRSRQRIVQCREGRGRLRGEIGMRKMGEFCGGCLRLFGRLRFSAKFSNLFLMIFLQLRSHDFGL